ncbi:MAG: TetR/AcrR family transcriptional regulator [Thermoleophilia bacterium]|nr:TetR/AcrR family transcriptional regulator [Thermoleophilia bacterium]
MAGGPSQQRSEVDSGDPGGDRERLVAAISRAAGEQGYDKLTVEHVIRYAGVPLATFYEHFATTEQGLIAAQDAFLDRIWLDVLDSCEAIEGWPAKVSAAVRTIVLTLAEASALARVFAVEATAASFAAAERHYAALDRFARLLRDGRDHYPQASGLPPSAELAVVGGIASIISRHLLAEEPKALAEMEPELVELVLLPYVGLRQASRIARG